jgi:transposase InsO family protein
MPVGEFVLDVDASMHGAGAILQQNQNGVLRVIAFASRLFNSAERSYCTTRQELAAAIFGLKRFRQYLLGQKVLIRSDHAALSFLRKTKDPVGQQARWLDFVEQFDVQIQHRAGSAHRAADALSRRPCELTTACPQCARGQKERSSTQCARVVTRAQALAGVGGTAGPASVTRHHTPPHPAADPPNPAAPSQDPPPYLDIIRPPPLQSDDGEGIGWSREQLVDLQHRDEGIGPVFDWLSCGHKPDWELMQSAGAESKVYWSQFDSLCIDGGLVYRRFERPEGGVLCLQLLVPRGIRTKFLEAVHVMAAGHLGEVKTLEHVQRRGYWPSWRTDTILFCRCCQPCASFRRGKPPRQAGLKPLLSGAPWEVLHIDLTGPHVTSKGYQYIFTACDSFTRFVVAFPLRDKSALSAAKVMVSEVVLKFGTPLAIMTDLGREWQNELWAEMCRLLNISRIRTTAYSPATNGKIERWHRVMNAMLGRVVDVSQKDWTTFLPFVVAAYNSTVHSATNFTPNYLTFGRELNSAADLAFCVPGVEIRSVNDYARCVSQRLADAFELVREHSGRVAQLMKREYDTRVRPVSFNVGDPVLYFCPRTRIGTSPKWTRFYSGPFNIVRKLNDVNYVIQLTPRSRLMVVHVNKLKAFRTFAPAV